jgi:hypothetical protein
MHWQHISKETISNTGKQWKIIVPKSNSFANADDVLSSLSNLTQPEPYIRRLNKLRIDRHWIELVEQGHEVRVQFEDWINKSLPRFQLTISCDDDTETWPMIYGPGMSIEDVLAYSIPWADVRLDIEAHKEGLEGDWAAECYMGKDPDDGQILYSMPFKSWYNVPDKEIVPVSFNGETEGYSLILELNELGKSFLIADSFLEEADDFEFHTFTLDQVP